MLITYATLTTKGNEAPYFECFKLKFCSKLIFEFCCTYHKFGLLLFRIACAGL